jgi:hypothetical protein
LHADGELDALFGRAGSTLIDIFSVSGSAVDIHDTFVGADGSVFAAGGDRNFNNGFVAKLLGAGGGESPGVLGIKEQSVVPTAEGGGEVTVTVRRTGGADGSVSVAYETAAENARPVEDFGHVSGLLSWGDGDMAEQQIRVPIVSDSSVEPPQRFRVILRDFQGGAGRGPTGATVEIAADGGPFGQLNFSSTNNPVTEGVTARIPVSRGYYSSGAVSVTVTPVAGTATPGADFAADPITLTWADGQAGPKVAHIQIVYDGVTEGIEDFTVRLSNPTGGAVIGPQSNLRIAIMNNQPPSEYGGGAFGFFSLVLLGLLRTIRRFTVGNRTIERS